MTYSFVRYQVSSVPARPENKKTPKFNLPFGVGRSADESNTHIDYIGIPPKPAGQHMQFEHFIDPELLSGCVI
jgi:hypothetical protein